MFSLPSPSFLEFVPRGRAFRATRALPAFLQSYLTNLVTAARSGPDTTSVKPMGSACRRPALGKAVLAISAQAKKAMIDDLGSAAFMVDLASMEHETQIHSDGQLTGPYSCRPSASARPAFNPCQRLFLHRRGESRMVIDIIVPCVDVAFKNQVLDGRVQ